MDKKSPVWKQGKNEEGEDEVVVFSSVCMLVLLAVPLFSSTWSLKGALGFPLRGGLAHHAFRRDLVLSQC
jgi:hypothetical protein